MFIRWLLIMSKVPYEPWKEYPHVWKTESAYLSFIRGGIRRYLWSKNPIKLEFEKSQQVKIPNDNPKSMKRFPTVAGFKCEHCNGLFKSNQVECDHKTGEYELRCLADIQKFVEGIVFVRKEDLAMLCKPCHGIKTYSQRYDVSLQEAKAIKQAIEIEKKGVKTVVAFLEKNGYNAASTKDKRRIQLEEHFAKETK